MSPREADELTYFQYTALCAGYRRANPPRDKDGKPIPTVGQAHEDRERLRRAMSMPVNDERTVHAAS